MRIGIVGSGNFSDVVYKSLLQITEIKLLGGFDTPRYSGLVIYEKLEDLLVQVDSILVFDILSSDYTTLSTIIKYGKDLYLENPGLCGIRELKNLEMLAYESGTQIQVGLKQRFYNFYSDLEKYHIVPRLLESKRYVKFNKNSTQLSVIEDLMLHDIDVTLKLCNSEVKSIYSTAVGVYYKDPDLVNTRIEFYNGCVANLSASKISNKDVHTTKFFQNNKYCSINFISQTLKVQSNSPKDEDSREEWGVKNTYCQVKDSNGYISMLEKEIISFYNCITNSEEPISGISQYLQLQSVTDRIKEQLERNFTTNA